MQQNPGKDEHFPESESKNDGAGDDIPSIDFRVDPRLLEELNVPEELLSNPPAQPRRPPPPGSAKRPAAAGSDTTASPPAAVPGTAGAARATPPAAAAKSSVPRPRHKPPPPPRPANPVPAVQQAQRSIPPPPAFSVVDDEQADVVPVRLDPSTYSTARAPGQPVSSVARSLFLRRTMIPILLTLGVMLPVLAILWFRSDPDSLVRRPGQWLPITFIVLGGIMLLLGMISMAQVKHLMMELRRQRVR